MTKKVMLINATDDESRIAIVENNILQEMLIEHQSREQIKGNIYKGIAVQVQTALQAAFVDFGTEKHGFLPKNEVNPTLYINKGASNKNSIQSRLKVGQSVMVQVTREAVDHKGAALTTNISIPGRFMVLMPHSDKGGVSKKIDDPEERDRLKSFLSGIEAEEHAVIIRTAGIGRSLAELKKDYTSLKRTWEDIKSTYENTAKPGVVHEEDDVVIRTLRDYYSEDIQEVWVDNPETFQKALLFMKEVAPRRQKDLKLFVGDRSLFSSYHIEKQVEQLTTREVQLKSGGSIVIDQTEALVAIDVNSGKSNQERNSDDTAVRTNLEAADEILRQLRLRNLGGLIVIDFIDMEKDESRKQVEDRLKNDSYRDKAKLSFGDISKFGLMEMSRQRLAAGISRTVESVCPVCAGKGRIPSLLASTNLIIRTIREMAAKGNLLRIESELPLELANHLLNDRRQAITDLELEFGIHIFLKGNPKLQTFEPSHIKGVAKSKKFASDVLQPQDTEKQETSRRRGRRKDTREKEQDTNKTAEVKETPVEDVTPEEQPADKKEKKEEKASKGSRRSRKTDKRKDEAAETVVEEVKEEAVVETPTQEKKEEKVAEEIVIEIPEELYGTDDEEDEPFMLPESTLHAACMFSDVKEPGKEELKVITTAFKNRLKGKINNETPTRIAEEFLWRSDPDLIKEKKEAVAEAAAEIEELRTAVEAANFVEETAPVETVDSSEESEVAEPTDVAEQTEEVAEAAEVAESAETVEPVEQDKENVELSEVKEPAKETEEAVQSPETVTEASEPVAEEKSTDEQKESAEQTTIDSLLPDSTEKEEKEEAKVEKAVEDKKEASEEAKAEQPEKPKTTRKRAPRARKPTGTTTKAKTTRTRKTTTTKKTAETAANKEVAKEEGKPVEEAETKAAPKKTTGRTPRKKAAGSTTRKTATKKTTTASTSKRGTGTRKTTAAKADAEKTGETAPKKRSSSRSRSTAAKQKEQAVQEETP